MNFTLRHIHTISHAAISIADQVRTSSATHVGLLADGTPAPAPFTEVYFIRRQHRASVEGRELQCSIMNYYGLSVEGHLVNVDDLMSDAHHADEIRLRDGGVALIDGDITLTQQLPDGVLHAAYITPGLLRDICRDVIQDIPYSDAVTMINRVIDG